MDITLGIPCNIPFAKLAAKIDYFPEDDGHQLKCFWLKRVKYRDTDGRVKFKTVDSNIPNKVVLYSRLTLNHFCEVGVGWPTERTESQSIYTL